MGAIGCCDLRSTIHERILRQATINKDCALELMKEEPFLVALASSQGTKFESLVKNMYWMAEIVGDTISQLSTERGVLSVARFCYVFPCELGGPAWAVGTYSISRGNFPKNYLQNLDTERIPHSVLI